MASYNEYHDNMYDRYNDRYIWIIYMIDNNDR